MFNCEFCNNEFKTEYILNTHKITAKYCLKLQGKTPEDVYICTYCSKTFITKASVIRHENICSSKITLETINTEKHIIKLNEEIIRLKEENIKLKEENTKLNQLIEKNNETFSQIKEQLTNQIIEKNNKIEKLENHFIKLAEKPVTINNNTNTNNNQRYNQIIQNLIPLKEHDFIQINEKLTYNHVKNKQEGYIELASEFYKNRAVCTDLSRKMVKYKDENGNLVTDPNMFALITKFFSAIKEKNKLLIDQIIDDLITENKNTVDNKDISDEYRNNKCALLLEMIADLKGIEKLIEDVSNNKDNEFRKKHTSRLCKNILLK